MSAKLLLKRTQRRKTLLRREIQNYITDDLIKPRAPCDTSKPLYKSVSLDVSQRLKTILLSGDNEEQFVNLFRSTTKPRLPQFFLTRSKEYDWVEQDVCNYLLQILYNGDQHDYAREFLEEIFDDEDLDDYGDTKDIVFSEWVRKMIRPGQLLVGREYMIHVVEKFCDTGSYPPVQSISPLIIKLSRCGHADTAWDLVHILHKRQEDVTRIATNALLDGLGRENKLEKMISLLPIIDKDIYTFTIIIHHLCKSQRVDDALQVFHDMELQPDGIIYIILVKGLCNVGRQEEALVLVDGMISQHGYARNIVIYNALIHGFCKTGEIERSQKLFEQMIEDGLVPTAFTYGAIIQAYCKVGQVDDALKLLSLMSEQGCNPNNVTIEIVRQFLTAAGETARLESFLQRYKVSNS